MTENALIAISSSRKTGPDITVTIVTTHYHKTMEHLSFLLVLVAATITIVLILFFVRKNNSVNISLIRKLRDHNVELSQTVERLTGSYYNQTKINSEITNELKGTRSGLTRVTNILRANDDYLNELRNELLTLHHENQLLKSKKRIAPEKEVKLPTCNLVLRALDLNKGIKTLMVKYPKYPSFRIKLTDDFAFKDYFFDSLDVTCLSPVELAIISADIVSHIKNNGTKLQKERLVVF